MRFRLLTPSEFGFRPSFGLRTSDFGLYYSSSQRARITHIAFVELDIFLSQVSGVDNRIRFPEVKADMQIKFPGSDRSAERLEGSRSRLAAFEAPENLAAAGRAVTDVHL